jgi:SPP1 gp7 family putative phage head morphogenesis protein
MPLEPTLAERAAIPPGLRKVASKEAAAWLRTASKVLFDNKELDRAAILAAEEYSLVAYVSRIMIADKARELLRAVGRAVRTGDIPKQFDNAKRTGELITTGLEQYDPRIAFQASVRSAYSAGRYERAMEAVDEEPYFVYRSMRDSRVRATHQVLNGVSLPKADPFWQQHYPPNGWRCRCKAYSLDEAGLVKLEKAGIPVQRTAPEEIMIEHKNKVTGEKEILPASIEPGWGFNPGTKNKKGAEQLAKMLENRMRILQTEDF